ncbi:hypothetical protein [Kutzneria sp. NPDC051319]|uniref:hypothetical protein n=1 Tax=Kutzneria sp. NPDC051319 TaxID=3155047 RepID=UPI0034194604
MTARIRRSTGTYTSVARLVLRKTKPELDLENYRNGAGFKVITMLKRVDDVSTSLVLSRGLLNLVPGQPITWKSRTGVTPLTGPFTLDPSGGRIPFSGGFIKCLLSTRENNYELGVPELDLPLVCLGLGIEAE